MSSARSRCPPGSLPGACANERPDTCAPASPPPPVHHSSVCTHFRLDAGSMQSDLCTCADCGSKRHAGSAAASWQVWAAGTLYLKNLGLDEFRTIRSLVTLKGQQGARPMRSMAYLQPAGALLQGLEDLTISSALTVKGEQGARLIRSIAYLHIARSSQLVTMSLPHEIRVRRLACTTSTWYCSI